MALNPGTKLGSFEILSSLGAGGQGEVYKALDTRLQRNVAIKVLPAHLSVRPEVRERFEREARTVSGLNHPHICVLHDIGVQDSTHFIVMEYLEGQTLADRLAKGPLPLPDALKYATEIADALDKAHRQGVVHRDLKPGNIMITKSGTKLLDFGLAKQAPAGSLTGAVHSAMPTAGVSPLTAEGTILGTLQYMAPEQLEGHSADARSDIFAFGAVLYEMVTGRRAFDGKSQASVMAAILERDPPPMSSVQSISPKLLDFVVKLCVAKNPDKRWQSMTDVLLSLDEVAAARPETQPAAAQKVYWLWPTVAVVLAAFTVWLSLTPFLSKQAPEPMIRFEVDTPSTTASAVALSPDGKYIAAVIRGQADGNVLWIRALENSAWQVLPQTQETSRSNATPFWSSDGRQIAFFLNGKLRKADVSGGSPQALCDAPSSFGGTWSRDGVIVFAPDATGPLYRVPEAGGIPTPVTELDKSRGETAHRYPAFLPDGKHFLFLAVAARPEDSAIYVASLGSKERKRLLTSDTKAIFASNYILFARDATIMAQSFDPKSLNLSGFPLRVAEGVNTNMVSGAASFSASANGELAYWQSATFSPSTQLLWVDRSGNQTGAIATPGPYANQAISPDLQRVAAFKGRLGGDGGDIWVEDLTRGTESKFTLTANTANNFAPLWSPDGLRIVFASNRQARNHNIYLKSSGGAGDEQMVLKSDHNKVPTDWSVDGHFILYNDTDPNTKLDVWALPITDGKPGTATPVLNGPFNESLGQFSPDMKWIAYVSDESGDDQVYVQSFPTSGTRYQISTNGGEQPRWRRDGKELFFLTRSGELMSVQTSVTNGTFHAGVPQKLFQTNLYSLDVFNHNRDAYDVTPDGQRFLLNTARSRTSFPIKVILNWASELQTDKSPR
jgi:serine/threonine protein kinase